MENSVHVIEKVMNNTELENNRKRSHVDSIILNVPTKKLRCGLVKELCNISQNEKSEKKSTDDVEDLFDNENYKNESTLESETLKENCLYCFSEKDIRKIAHIEYNKLYDIHIFSNKYENSSNGLAVISDYNLDSEIAQFKETSHGSEVALRTFIINLRDSHWVTLVVSYQSGVYIGYYVDSLYDKDGEGNEINKIPENIKEILIKRAINVEDLKIHQQNNSYNCDLIALENAKDINDVVRSSYADRYKIFQCFQLPRDENYFIARREYFTKKLNINGKEEGNAAEFSVNTSNQQDENSKSEIGNTFISTKEEVFPKFYTALQYSYPYTYDQYTSAKMRGYFNLLGIIYQLHFLMMCYYRTFVVHKYSACSLAVEKVGVGRFDDVVLYHRNEAICIQIKHLDTERYYNSIGYLELFPRGQRKQQGGMFSINRYFSSFIEMKNISDVKYLLIYTNADLNLTEGMKLKRPKWSRDFFPLKFDIIDIDNEEYKILKDCLFIKGTSDGHGFYRFSLEEATRRKLIYLLEGNNSTIYDAGYLLEMKNIFLEKLILVVNQPGREELNYMIKREIDQRCKTHMVPHVFNELQEGMLSYLTNPKGIYITKENAGMFLKLAEETDSIDTIEQDNKYVGEYKKAAGLRNCTPHLIYKLELFMHCLYRMYQRSDGISISAENDNVDIASNICFHYEDKITYVWTKYGSGGCINYSMLFPGKDEEGIEMFSLNKYFREYIANVDTEIWRVEHLVIYTNMGLDLTEEVKFIDVPIKFNSMDIRNHKVLMHYLCTNKSKFEHGFYQFSSDKETRSILLSLLDPRDFKNYADKLEGFKIAFLEKLVFAVNQPDRKKLVSITKEDIQQSSEQETSSVLLEYIALHEVALRCLSASKIYCITRKIVIETFRDIKTNRISSKSIRIPDEEKDEFARTIVAHRGLCHFREFREFLDSKEGWNMFDVLCRNKVDRNMSCMLMPAGIGVVRAFRKLYYMLFCKDGDKSDLLKSLIDKGLKLRNVSSILNRAGNKAPEALKELCAILNKELDDGKTYLEFFAGKNILENISSMLNGAGSEAANSLEDLYNVLISKIENQETYLEFILRKNIMKHISSMLNGAGNQSANALVAVYNVFITKLDNEETLLEFILRKNIMKNISSMLSGTGNEAAHALEELYNTLMKKLDKKETFLDFTLRKNILGNISSMLSGAGCSAPEALKSLITLLSTKSHGEISYLEFLIDKKIMKNISSILHGAGLWASKTLPALCTLLRKKLDGEKTYLEFFTEKKIMGNISCVLNGAGKRAVEAFEALCMILRSKFNEEMTYLEFFIEKKIIINIFTMLNGTGKRVPEALEALCKVLNRKYDSEMTFMEFFVKNKIMANISSMLSGAGQETPGALAALCTVLRKKMDGERTYLEFFVEKKIMGNISIMLSGSGKRAPEALEALCLILNRKFDGEKTFLDFFVESKIMGNISNMLTGAGPRISEAFEALFTKLNTKLDGEISYLQFFVKRKAMGNISNMLYGAGYGASEAFEALFSVLNTRLNGKTYLEIFVEKKIFENISSMLNGAGQRAPEALNALCTLLNKKFDDEMSYLEYFMKKKIIKNISSMLAGAGQSAPEALEALYAILRTKLDDEMTYLQFFSQNKIEANISSMLNGAGKEAPGAFAALCKVLRMKMDYGKTYLEYFVEKKIMGNISTMLSGSGKRAPEALEALCLILNRKFDGEKTYLDFFVDNKIMGNISGMLTGAGPRIPEAFEALFTKLNMKFEGEINYLQFLVKRKVMGNISSMLYRAGYGASEAFEALFSVFNTRLDGKTYLEIFVENKILGNICSILKGAGRSAPEALEALCTVLNKKLDGEKTYLEYFMEKKIIRNISSMLAGAGQSAPEALEALYTILRTKLDDEMTYLQFFSQNKIEANISSMLNGAGKEAPGAFAALCKVLRMKMDYGKTYLEFFVEKKIMGNISTMLSGAGKRAPEALEALCLILNRKFDGEKTYLNFFLEKNVLGNISSMLNGSGRCAPEVLKELCAILSTKFYGKMTYLDFIVEKKIMGNISCMLIGARRGVPGALKELISLLCTKLNDENTYLDFFLENKVFKSISSMLRSAGNRAPEALKELHDLLFNKQYLEHFTKEGLNLRNLSGMLNGTRGRAPYTLRKVHSLCFDVKGNKTKYFSDLISANYSGPMLFSILRSATLI